MNDKEAVLKALRYLSDTKRGIIRSALFDQGSVVASTLGDLSPADVPDSTVV